MTYEVQTVRLSTKAVEELLNAGAAKGWKLVTVQVEDKTAWLFWEKPA